MTNENYYSTSDLALAATISLYRPVEKIDNSNPKRVLFFFKKSRYLTDLITLYWKKHLNVEPQQYFNQLKSLKTQIYTQQP